jgi:hypothetical protein
LHPQNSDTIEYKIYLLDAARKVQEEAVFSASNFWILASNTLICSRVCR